MPTPEQPAARGGPAAPEGRPAPLVRHRHAHGVTTLTLDSPHNRNALSRRLVRELHRALGDAAADPQVRAVLLRHTGTTFCAGADLTEATGRDAAHAPAPGGPAAEETSPPEPPPDGPQGLVHLMRAVLTCPKPVLARVTGHVRAGGLGLLGACDISVAGAGATFAFTEARLGLAPAVISLPLLRSLDPRAAARYYLSGERFDAVEAARIGLVTLAATGIPAAGPGADDGEAAGADVGEAAGADVDAVLAPVLDGLRRGSPQGLAESKRLVTAEVLRAFDRDAAELVERSGRLFASAEAREGMTAFLERREPPWAR